MGRTADRIGEMGDRGQHRHERWLREPGGRLRLPLAPAWRWDLAVGVGLLAVTALVLLLGR